MLRVARCSVEPPAWSTCAASVMSLARIGRNTPTDMRGGSQGGALQTSIAITARETAANPRSAGLRSPRLCASRSAASPIAPERHRAARCVP